MLSRRPSPSLRTALATLLAAAGASANAAPAPAPWALLAGSWSNAVQHGQADPALHRPPAAGHPYDWLDHQHARFTPVRIDGLDGQAVHLVWRSGGPDGPISRQRIWLFRQTSEGQWQMAFHTPRSPETLPESPAPGATLTVPLADLVGYGPACTLPVTTTAGGFVAHIPEGCAITARSGRAMTLSASIRLDGDTLTYAEAGTLFDGSIAFKVPGGPPYRFQRRD